MRDNLRPSEAQINDFWRCDTCQKEIEQPRLYGEPSRCNCGGHLRHAGESYPASSNDWEEERDNEYSEWRQRR